MNQSPVSDFHPDYRMVSATSPFFSSAIGECFVRHEDGHLIAAIRTGEPQSNLLGQVHGGMILAAADVALGMAIQDKDPSVMTVATIHLEADYVRPAAIGSWLELVTSVIKIGQGVGFVDARVVSEATTIARVSGIFNLGRNML